MKYFNREIWAGWQTKDWKRWDTIAKMRWKRYDRQLLRLENRVSPKYWGFFADKKYNLHDGRISSIKIVDRLESRRLEKKSWKSARHITDPTMVEIHAFDSSMKYLYLIKYDSVRRIHYDFPSDNPLFFRSGQGTGDWGFDELVAANDKYLRHEILFASGTTLLIEFKGFSFKRKKLT